jgi:hypothetical protein
VAWRHDARPDASKHDVPRTVRTALRQGQVVRPTRGWIALPDADEARFAAARLSGVVSHLTAGPQAKPVPTGGARGRPPSRRTCSSPCSGPSRWTCRAKDLQPQILIDEEGFVGRPDLVDVRRRLVVEAESFEFHGRRAALRRDCERYNALVLRDCLVLRFSWEHVMHKRDYVATCLRMVARRPLGRAPPRRRQRKAA